jgi:hypothetical protein
MKKAKNVTGKCSRVASWAMKQNNQILCYKMILGEDYKFEYVGNSYRVHGLWMPEISRTGRPVKTYIVMQPQNIVPFFTGDIINEIGNRIGFKYVEKWANYFN